MRRRRENKRECGEGERVPDELLADEGNSSWYRWIDVVWRREDGG